MPTLLTPFAAPTSAPALILPASSPTPNLTLSYAQLSHQIDQLRLALDQWDGTKGALGKGDTVSMSLVNGVEFVAAFLAIGAHRCVAAPLNPSYNASEVSFYLSDTNSRLLLLPRNSSGSPAAKAAAELGVPVAEVWFDGKDVQVEFKEGQRGKGGRVQGSGRPEEADVALVLHTSGTTGRPKAVPLTHLNLSTTMSNIVRTYSLTPSDRTMLVMPLFHVHGLLAALLAPLLSGGSIVLPPKFSAGSFWKEMRECGGNWYTAVPTIHQILLRSPHPFSGESQFGGWKPNLRFIRSCSSALAPATFAELEKTFQAPVLEAYAMTEAAHQMTSNPLPPLARKPGTVGLPQGISIRILALDSDTDVEEGEVAIKGQNVTPGYIGNPKANKESFTDSGYFRTGDRGRLDKEGYLTLTGRLKELINRGGEKISPLEVDAALLSVEGVGEAVAFGVEDEKFGEKVWAAVVLKSNAKLGEKQIIDACRQKISAFKCPERIFLLDQIPKTATGKVQRKSLATKFAKEVKESNKMVKAKL